MILFLLLALMLLGLAVALAIRATPGSSELEVRDAGAGCRLRVGSAHAPHRCTRTRFRRGEIATQDRPAPRPPLADGASA